MLQLPATTDSPQNFIVPIGPDEVLKPGVKGWKDDDRPYIIHAEKLEKVYDVGTPRETKALRGVNLDISLGEIVLIFGSSGSGKSTLLNILAALDKPTAGLIKVDDKDLSKLTYKQMVEYHQFKIGMVFQAYNLIPNLTVMQNITMPARLAGFKRKEYVTRGKDLLKQFQLEKIHDRLASNLSGGQQQRVAIMRSLMNRPAMIIADEPTGNLDSENSRMMMDIFKRMNEETTTTMVIVSHDPSLFEIADRVVHILDGKVTKQTILSPKAKIDPKTIDVPIDYRLTPDEKEQLLRELGAKTAYKEKSKIQSSKSKTDAAEKAQPKAVEEVRKQWQAEEEEMVKIKKSALERLTAKAKQAEQDNVEVWAKEEEEMKQLKAMSLQRVQVRKRGEKAHWQKEEEEMKQLKVIAVQRVEVRRKTEEKVWQHEEDEMQIVKKLSRARIKNKTRTLREAQGKAWVAEEADMVQVKKSALERLKRKAAAEEKAQGGVWAKEEDEMMMVKRLAMSRIKKRQQEEQEQTREAIHRAARAYGPAPAGKKVSSFSRLVTHHQKLEPEEQRILALLLVLLDRKQQDSLSDQQIWRIFFAIDKRLSGEFDYSALLNELDRSEKDGGVGLYRQTAEHIATGLETMLQIKKS